MRMVPQVTEEPLGGSLPPINQPGPGSQPQPMPMGLPLNLPGQQQSCPPPVFLPQQQPPFANASSAQNPPGLPLSLVNPPTSTVHNPLHCYPSCPICVSMANMTTARKLAAADACHMKSQQNYMLQPPMLLPTNTGGQTDYVTRPGGSSAVPSQPNMLLPAPQGPPSLHTNPPKFNGSGSYANPYGEVSPPKPNQLPQMAYNPALMPVNNSSMGVPMNLAGLNNGGRPQSSLPGSFPESSWPPPMPVSQSMPLPNQVNDAQGSNSLGPLSAPPLPQPSLPGNPPKWIDIYVPSEKPTLAGPFTPYKGLSPPMASLPNHNNNPVETNLPPPLMFRPQTSAGPVQRFGPPPQPSSLPPPMPFPTASPAKNEELDLARQLGYLNINSDGIEPPKTPVTPKDLQDTQKDLTPLANAMIYGAKPFDNTATIRDHLVRLLALQYNWEWMLSLRTHTFGDDGAVSTKEEILAPNTFPIVEYDKAMKEGKYPLFVLTHWGTRDNDILCSMEFTWKFGNMEQQIKNRKRALFLGKAHFA